MNHVSPLMMATPRALYPNRPVPRAIRHGNADGLSPSDKLSGKATVINRKTGTPVDVTITGLMTQKTMDNSVVETFITTSKTGDLLGKCQLLVPMGNDDDSVYIS